MSGTNSSELEGNRKIRFLPVREFEKELRARVDEYFNDKNLTKRDNLRMYGKTAIVLSWLIASYVFLVFMNLPTWGIVLSAVSLSLALNAVGFNIMHDGNHRAYSNNPYINKLMGYSLDLIGGSSYFWNWKHNYLHHTYPNITGIDDDIEPGIFARLSPHQKRYFFHRYQHIYIWIIYGFLIINWHVYQDFYNYITKKIHNHTFPRPKGWDLFMFFFGKILFFSLALVIPSFFYPFWAVALAYFLIVFAQGIVLTIVFQLAHCNEEADFVEHENDDERLGSSWLVHQLKTTADFSRDNKILNWYVGGLNFQVEHHLFPKICHVHYPELSKIVEKTCNEFGITYNAYKNLSEGIASHYRWIYQMGRA
ncbi:MAG TPA: acyl-CoA desaturase [Thermodesulfobacteriota bacterium]|jgi:linoleoyl-CoA desaturase|nr:acyl-CoA desaturase [Thermodesulfobacteriota bacterium]